MVSQSQAHDAALQSLNTPGAVTLGGPNRHTPAMRVIACDSTTATPASCRWSTRLTTTGPARYPFTFASWLPEAAMREEESLGESVL